MLSAIWPAAVERLRARHEVVVAVNPAPHRLAEVLRDCHAAVLRSPVRLDGPTLEAAVALRLVVRAGTGTDSIDLGRAAELGVRVVVIPGSARSVAEHAIGLLLALCAARPGSIARCVQDDGRRRPGTVASSWASASGRSASVASAEASPRSRRRSA